MFYFKRAKTYLVIRNVFFKFWTNFTQLYRQASHSIHRCFRAKAVTIAETNLDSFHSHSKRLRNFEDFRIKLCFVLLPSSNFWWLCRYNIKFYLDKQHCTTNLFHLLRGFYLLIRFFFFQLSADSWDQCLFHRSKMKLKKSMRKQNIKHIVKALQHLYYFSCFHVKIKQIFKKLCSQQKLKTSMNV